MSEPLRIEPDVLREVAGHHDEVIGHVETARSRGDEIAAAVQSLGPIFHGFKSAVTGEVLPSREDELAALSGRHSRASDDLNRLAAQFTADDQNEAARLRRVEDA
ncbi:type VII secretion target [Mycobacterium sp. SMC-17]|uniref:type VII secretion target n=1 Tax=Mycobacterium sp. SMC-17 TaxID=3381628 RepID=UPI0038766890